MKKLLVFLLGILLIPTVLIGISFEVSAQTPPKGVLRGAILSNVSADWLDPGAVSPQVHQHMALYMFHDALVKPMPGGLYTPSLAESWTISPDYKTFKFNLRKGVKFHNGDEMTAEDVVYSFKRYNAGPAKMLHDRIDKLEAENPYLFSVTFKESFPDFFEYLLPGASAIGWVVPKKHIEKVGDAEFKKNPVGCGPYKFVEFVSGVRLIGEAYDNFWRKKPAVRRHEIFTIPERSTRFAMLQRGEVDYAISMADVFYEKVKSEPKLRMEVFGTPNNNIIYFAAQWDPKSPWSDVRIRKAASLALDRKKLEEVIYPGGGPIGTLALQGDPEGIRFPPDPYDPEKAKKLLAEAGYPKGFHGGKFFAFEEHKEMGEMVMTYWRSIGIEVDFSTLVRSVWLAQHNSGKMKDAIFFDILGAPTINARLNYLFGPTNYGNYPDMKEMYDKYSKMLDPKERKEMTGKIQQLIYDRTMVVPTIQASYPTGIGPRVKGNLFRIVPVFPIHVTSPMEDLELNE